MRSSFRLVAVLSAAGAVLAAAPAAGASSWTRTQSFSVGKRYEPAPRAAIAADGTSAVAWRSKTGKLMLATGSSGGRFAQPRPIDRAGAREWSVAARPGGGVLVAWQDTDGIHAAVRARSGAAIAVRRVVASTGEEINGLQVAADPLGGWALAELQFRATGQRFYDVRAMTLAADGRLQGAVQDLGPGDFGIDARPTQAIAVDDRGRAVLAFRREQSAADGLGPTPLPVLVTTRPHGGAFSAPVALSGDATADPRVAVGAGGRALIAATQVRSSGDAGVFGNPVVAAVAPAGTLGDPVGPPLSNPKRAFAPSAAFTSQGRSVLVFQLKTGSQPFQTEAPVRAVALGPDGSPGPLQTLTAGQAKEPVVMSLRGGRALALWSGRSGLGASLAGPDGRFEKTAEPKGPPPEPFHSNPTNRDLRTAGRWAIFAWGREADGRVRVSVRGF
ncbi:MAG: hypothetical protein QOI73_495 [Solirubrobacteraceae bacterium]|nr:hypothetical protein [Solirubrobacteraceae bacterium]